MELKIQMLEDEKWYGGNVTDGINQPYTMETDATIELRTNLTPNQQMPLLLSTKGRSLWHKEGFIVRIHKGMMECDRNVSLYNDGNCLKDAYLTAMKRYFPFHDIRLDHFLFEHPVYNTWIELTFHQTQTEILKYARAILEYGYPVGTIIIDDGWGDYYGKWEFSAAFPSPEKLIEELHNMGFKVMLWICPFITPDTIEYRYLEGHNALVKEDSGESYITHWWNGWSAILDMTNEFSQQWLKAKLSKLIEMGIDGFKFDGGDSFYYPADGNKNSLAWAEFGEQFSFNEFRVTSGCGGFSLIQRLCDKDHSWGDKGLKTLIPDAIVQGLTGHPFISPDMIGGGEYLNFYSQSILNEELFVRWAGIAAFMPMMQFSAAPWRILSTENQERIKRILSLREKYMPYILETIEECKRTGAPIIRSISYEDANYTSSAIESSFYVGSRLFIAPILEKDQLSRNVYLSKGKWMWEDAEIVSAGEYYKFESIDGILIFWKM